MSPWRHKLTFFERCRATSEKPSMVKTGSNIPSSGAENSTNSKPSKPMGLSNRSAILHLNRQLGDQSPARARFGALYARMIKRDALLIQLIIIKKDASFSLHNSYT
eukprot:TRINITY_DN80667_c0_g1_i1.p4 TRINITY_DN80667_c0_g1~~TRINITY_DN80667_c0_g1_i1.p4  ORF type:complete len:106 (+),score=1.42 TRINITY_DN80667_c0_g1_i1:106-423(+)